jgi:hypothetical protein
MNIHIEGDRHFYNFLGFLVGGFDVFWHIFCALKLGFGAGDNFLNFDSSDVRFVGFRIDCDEENLCCCPGI